MSEKQGKIIQSLSLYEEETLILLRQAYQRLAESELNETITQRVVFPDSGSRYAVSSSEESCIEEDGSDSSSSHSDESDADEEPREIAVGSTSVSEIPSLDEGITKKNRRSRKEPHKRHFTQQVNQHSANLVTTSIPLDDESAILMPSALLGKDRLILDSDLKSKCQFFINLTDQLVQRQPIVVILMRSGRFASGVFEEGRCIMHRACQRYTIRKGQGKAQSAQDGKRKPKSIGSQLRRAGEQSLKEDIHSTIMEWKEQIQNASLILLSCPKTMKSTLFTESLKGILPRDDSRICKIPIDVGRPTYESVCVVHEVMTTSSIREVTGINELKTTTKLNETVEEKSPDLSGKEDDESFEMLSLPLSDLHVAAMEGNLSVILDLLGQKQHVSIIDRPAGSDFMTPLHFAAESTSKVDPVTSAACVTSLLIQGHADPCALDARHRLPYFLASHERVREAFRKARAFLGEDYCDWETAKVGPPLTEEAIQARKDKEAEKRRKKKARQKGKKAREKAQAEELERRRKEEEINSTSRKGIETGEGDCLKAKSKDNVCDFCQRECKGKRRQQMFKRLDYSYCSTDCVQKHKRKLMADAALARFGS